MPIKGDLTRIDLAGIFQMLTLNQNEGTLNIYYEGMHKSIYFSSNGLIMPFDMDTMEDRVISLLLRQGKLSEEQIERARYNTSTLNTNLLGAIQQMRYVSEEDVQAAFLLQMEEDIYDLFLVTDAQFEFLEDEKPSDTKTMDERFILSPNNLLMEAVRRGDEWAHIKELVPSELEVYELVDSRLPDGVEDENQEYSLIMSVIDGVRSIKRIIEETRLHRFTVFKSCSVLVEAGKLVPVDIQQLVARADECIKATRTHDAIDLFSRAVAAGYEDAGVFEKLGYAYKSVSEHKAAVEHFYKLCEQYEAKGALKQAIKIYHLIRELMPMELVARERVFQLFLYNQELFEDSQYDAFGEGRQLALIFKEIGRKENSQEIVQLLFEAYREHEDVLEVLAQLALDIRDAATALMILEHLGERLMREGEASKALKIFRRIKCIDPEFRGIDDKLDRLMETDLARRKKKSRILKTATLIVVLISLVYAYFMFNSIAFDAFTKINYDDMMAKNQFDQAREEYKGFCAKFPLSIYWFLARERLTSIASMEERHTMAKQLRSEYDTQEKLESQRNAENFYEDAMAHFNASDLETALRLFKKADDAATDPAWCEEQRLESKIRDLETYFDEAKAIKEKADKAIEGGKFEEAHGDLARLAGNYALSPSARGVRLPLLVKSSPSGARIMVNGAAATVLGGDRTAVTPAVVGVKPSNIVTVQVEKEGFMAESRKINSFECHTLNMELRFTSEKRYRVGENLAVPPVYCGSSLVAGYRDGRVKLFQFGTEKFEWVFTLNDLLNLESPLSVFEDKVLFCSGKERITVIEKSDGTLCWETVLPSPASLAPIFSNGKVFAPLDEGKVLLLDPASGKSLAEIKLKCKPVLDPVPWDQGAILALEDGGLAWIDGEKEKVLRVRWTSGRASALSWRDDEIVVGTVKGSIESFHRNKTEVLYTFDTKADRAVDQVVSRGSRLYAVMGKERLVSIDTTRLQVIGDFFIEGERLWISQGGGSASVAVGGSNSVIYLLRASDLTLMRKYRADGEIEYPGFEMDGCVYFYSRDGMLNGIRY